MYADWCEYQGFQYKPFNYPNEKTLPYIPLEREIDQLIGAFAHSKYGAMLQLLKETAFRPIEAMRLTCQDVDLERQIVTLNKPAKRSNPRQVKISDKLTAMLKPLVNSKHPNELVWSVKSKYISRVYVRNRKRIAKKLGNPNINKISLKTFRHFKVFSMSKSSWDIRTFRTLLSIHIS
ncbi:MAG: tyrosine-type recombinase/integrase [Candidatus Hodarchaeales archaeon]